MTEKVIICIAGIAPLKHKTRWSIVSRIGPLKSRNLVQGASDLEDGGEFSGYRFYYRTSLYIHCHMREAVDYTLEFKISMNVFLLIYNFEKLLSFILLTS